jgi:hypothetical protein
MEVEFADEVGGGADDGGTNKVLTPSECVA